MRLALRLGHCRERAAEHVRTDALDARGAEDLAQLALRIGRRERRPLPTAEDQRVGRVVRHDGQPTPGPSAVNSGNVITRLERSVFGCCCR